jgi:hypothetical protein
VKVSIVAGAFFGTLFFSTLFFGTLFFGTLFFNLKLDYWWLKAMLCCPSISSPRPS